MTTDAGRRKEKIAKGHHESGAYDEASEAYTEAAYEYIGANGLSHSSTVARGLRDLIVGATCLRHQSRMQQCQNRCWQGNHIAEAVAEKAMALPRESYAYDQSVRGVWYEFIGDFRVVGDLPGAAEAYDQAAKVYEDAGDPQTAAFEQSHMAVAVLPKLLFRGTDADTDELEAFLYPGPTLTDWIDFKRRRLPDVLERLDDRDDWTYVF